MMLNIILGLAYMASGHLMETHGTHEYGHADVVNDILRCLPCHFVVHVQIDGGEVPPGCKRLGENQASKPANISRWQPAIIKTHSQHGRCLFLYVSKSRLRTYTNVQEFARVGPGWQVSSHIAPFSSYAVIAELKCKPEL